LNEVIAPIVATSRRKYVVGEMSGNVMEHDRGEREAGRRVR
jgi:hypothetical protein